jgi:vacuolar-type H+-ATPase subunit H
LEANTGVLKDLANREAALTQKVEAARGEALKIVADAESRAREILARAETDATALEAEFKARSGVEEKSILESGVAAARTAADSARASAHAKIADAVKTIVAKVIP